MLCRFFLSFSLLVPLNPSLLALEFSPPLSLDQNYRMPSPGSHRNPDIIALTSIDDDSESPSFLSVWDAKDNGGPPDWRERGILGMPLDSLGQPLLDTPLTLAEFSQSQQKPALAQADDGTILLIWEDTRGSGDSDLFGRYLTPEPGATYSLSEVFTVSASLSAETDAEIAAYEDTFHIVWERRNFDPNPETGARTEVHYKRVPSRSFPDPRNSVQLTTAVFSSEPDIAAGNEGTILVGYSVSDGAVVKQITPTTSGPGGELTIISGASIEDIEITPSFDQPGTFAVILSERVNTDQDNLLGATVAASEGTLSIEAALSQIRGTFNHENVSAAPLSNGDYAVALGRKISSTLYRYSPDTGIFSILTGSLTSAFESQDPEIACVDDRCIVVWEDRRIDIQSYEKEVVLSTSIDLSPVVEDPRLAQEVLLSAIPTNPLTGVASIHEADRGTFYITSLLSFGPGIPTGTVLTRVDLSREGTPIISRPMLIHPGIATVNIATSGSKTYAAIADSTRLSLLALGEHAKCRPHSRVDTHISIACHYELSPTGIAGWPALPRNSREKRFCDRYCKKLRAKFPGQRDYGELARTRKPLSHW